MAQICFQLICFNADAFLEPVLQSIAPMGDVVVTEGPVSYWQDRGFKRSTDTTLDILDRYVPHRMRVHGQFKEKDDMMRACEHLIPKHTTHVWMVDADEIYTPEMIRMMQNVLDDYDSASFIPYTFYGGFERYLTGFEEQFEWIRVQRWRSDATWHTHRPPTVLNERGTPYRQCRHLVSRERFYHYSYVFPQQVKTKIEYYTSWNQGVIPNYFNDVYLQWVNARTSDARQQVESRYNGVHEWLPRRRTDCYTAKFMGRHPQVIQEHMKEYTARMRDELKMAPMRD